MPWRGSPFSYADAPSCFSGYNPLESPGNGCAPKPSQSHGRHDWIVLLTFAAGPAVQPYQQPLIRLLETLVGEMKRQKRAGAGSLPRIREDHGSGYSPYSRKVSIIARTFSDLA